MDHATESLQNAFAPVDAPWTPVSPVLATAYRISLGITAVLVLVGIGLFSLIPRMPRWIPLSLLVITLVVVGWTWWVIGRRVRSWGYAEREADLLVTSGILFRRLVVVPYGRMQLVDLKAGPIHRMLHLATVQLHTAAATTDASIPGLRPQVAADLRDRLARLGEQRSAGL